MEKRAKKIVEFETKCFVCEISLTVSVGKYKVLEKALCEFPI